MTKDTNAVKAYKYFSTLEGNQHIASEFALSFINRLIGKFKMNNILELGLGIGSICYSVHIFCDTKGLKITYTGTESNHFCLEALPEYLNGYFKKLKLYPNLSSIPDSSSFELIIIDGIEENLEKVKRLITKNGIILIEGDRIPQLEIIRKSFPKAKYVRVISMYKNPDYGPFSPTHWCGGVQLVLINPTFKQNLFYLHRKLLTSINYRLRKVI